MLFDKILISDDIIPFRFLEVILWLFWGMGANLFRTAAVVGAQVHVVSQVLGRHMVAISIDLIVGLCKRVHTKPLH